MSEWVELIAKDGVKLQAFVARPAGEPKGSLVVVQEIFGVNKQIQHDTEQWAADGYLCIAPAMFDRIEPNVKLDYDEEGWAKAMSFVPKLDMDKATLDVDAAVQWLRGETSANVGVVGYCFGGTMAWLSSTRLKVEAAVGYYGGNIANFLNEEPQVPVMLHFGKEDAHIPAEMIEKIQTAHPEVPIFLYDNAGHAFNRSEDHKAYVVEAARLAKSRSLLFFDQHLVF
ncbi:MAG: dienelactone hydrolase family protein [Janthinobacterium lividum]